MQPDLSNLPLRDIHIPTSVSWWPLAPGWWLLLASSVILITTLLLLIKKRQRLRIKKSALAEFHSLRTNYQNDCDKQKLLTALSILLRRVSISYLQRPKAAALTGTAWLHCLDSLTSTRALPADVFSQGIGRLFAAAPYQKNFNDDPEALLQLCELWLKHLPAMPTPGKPLKTQQTGTA